MEKPTAAELAAAAEIPVVKRPRGRPPKTPQQKEETKVLREMRRNGQLPMDYGQENVKPGDNSKFLSHALAVASMPPVDTNSAAAVKERVNEYFQLCLSNDMKPTVTGLCNAFKINKSTLLLWKQGTYRKDTHQAIILEAYAVMENLWEEYMLNGKINPVSGIFLSKNLLYGYADKQEVVLTPNTGMAEAVDPAAIEAKYAELPED